MSRHAGDVLTRERRDSHVELVQRLRAAQKHSVGAPAWSRYVNRPVGRHLAAAAYRAGLRPDQVTGLSALASFTAIALLAVLEPSWLLGAAVAVLLVLGYALDSADGQLARLQGSSSPAGEWLDHVVDSAKIVCLHAAVLLQLQRWDGLSEAWSLVPLAFLVVASVSFFTMILNEQLRRRAGQGPARAGARASTVRALLALPTDYGVLCCSFVLLGAGTPFLLLYALLLAGTAGHLALALPVWRREMLALGADQVRARTARLAMVAPVALLALSLAACSQGTGQSVGAAASRTSTEATATTGTSAGAAGTDASAPAATPTASTDAPTEAGPAVAAPPAPTSTDVVPAAADGAIPELAPVPVGEVVDAGGGLTAEVVEVEASRITGGVPGDIAGPAVAVTVEVSNGGTVPADIAFVTVSAAYGDGQEASGFDGGPAEPLVGPIPAGETRRGTYVFGVPDQGAGTLKVRVGTDPARPLAVFTADASVWGDR